MHSLEETRPQEPLTIEIPAQWPVEIRAFALRKTIPAGEVLQVLELEYRDNHVALHYPDPGSGTKRVVFVTVTPRGTCKETYQPGREVQFVVL